MKQQNKIKLKENILKPIANFLKTIWAKILFSILGGIFLIFNLTLLQILPYSFLETIFNLLPDSLVFFRIGVFLIGFIIVYLIYSIWSFMNAKLKKNRAIWIGAFAGLLIGFVIPLNLAGNVLLVLFSSLFHAPTEQQGIANLLFISKLMPVVFAVFGALVGLSIKKTMKNKEFFKNPFVIGFLIALMYGIITTFKISLFSMSIIFYTLLGTLAVVISTFINKKSFLDRFGHFRITFICFILGFVGLLIIILHYNLLSIVMSSFSLAELPYSLMNFFIVPLIYLGSGLIGDGIFYFLKKKQERFAQIFKSVFIITAIFLFLISLVSKIYVLILWGVAGFI